MVHQDREQKVGMRCFRANEQNEGQMPKQRWQTRKAKLLLFILMEQNLTLNPHAKKGFSQLHRGLYQTQVN